MTGIQMIITGQTVSKLVYEGGWNYPLLFYFIPRSFSGLMDRDGMKMVNSIDN